MFLIPASSLQLVCSPTDWTSCAPSYKIVRRPPSSCERHKSHSFNPSTVKVIFWYSSTGCTCYLYRCISYFDSLAGVNMLHRFQLCGATIYIVSTVLYLSLLRALVVCLKIPCLSFCVSLAIKPFLYSMNMLTVLFHLSTTLSDCIPFKNKTLRYN